MGNELVHQGSLQKIQMCLQSYMEEEEVDVKLRSILRRSEFLEEVANADKRLHDLTEKIITSPSSFEDVRKMDEIINHLRGDQLHILNCKRRLLDGELEDIENELKTICENNAKEIIQLKKEHSKKLENMEKEKIDELHEIDEHLVGIEQKIHDLKINNEIEKHWRLEALKKDVILLNYSRILEDLKKLAVKVQDILEKTPHSEIIHPLTSEIGFLFTKILEFQNADDYFEQRKTVCKELSKELDEISPQIRNDHKIDEVTCEVIKYLANSIIDLSSVEQLNFLENCIRRQNNYIEQ